MSTLRLSRRIGAVLGGAVLFALAACSSPGNRPVPWRALAVEPLNCRARWADGRCEPDDKGELRVAVTAPSQVPLTVLLDGVPTGFTTQDVSGEQRRLVTVKIAPGAQRLTVQAGGGLFSSKGTVDVRRRTEPAWLTNARKLLYANQSEKAQPILEEQLAPARANALSDADRAQALSVLGQVRYEAGLTDQALQTFSEARTFDRKAGLIAGETAGEAFDTINILRLQLQKRQLKAAEQELAASAPAFDRAPELRSWQVLQRAYLSLYGGLLDQSFVHLEETIRLGRRDGDSVAPAQAKMLRSTILMFIGHRADALADLREIAIADLHACRRANHHEKLGLLALDEIEAGTRAPSGEDEATDPRVWFRRALALRSDTSENGCEQKSERNSDRHALAQALIAFGQLDEATALIDASEKELPGARAAMQVDRLDLRGRILLARGDIAGAASKFTAIDTLARQAKTSELDDFDFFDAEWRSAVGLAQAQGATDPARAIDSYLAAEALLDKQAAALPLSARSDFVGRHERATARLLDLLRARGDLARAFQVMRNARLRAFTTIENTTRSGQIGDAPRTALQDLITRYRQDRKELESTAVELDRGMTNEEEREQQRRQKRLVDQSLQSAWLLLPGLAWDASSLPAPAPAEAGEVSLICHPAVKDLFCLAQTVGAPLLPISLPRLDREPDPARLQQQLVAPLGPLLEKARRLRVLAYGDLRRIDLGVLRLGDQALEDRLAIVHALDLPRAARRCGPAARGPRPVTAAIVYPTDPRRAEAPSIEQQLAASLGGLFDARMHVRPTDHGDGVPGATLRHELAVADLALLISHGIPLGRDTIWNRAIKTEDRTGFTIGDVLTLPEVPCGVVAVGCGLGGTSAEVGGVEAPGLSQAFVLRGASWAIGSVIAAVDPPTANELLTTFAAELARDGASLTDPPARALARARRIVGDRHPGDSTVAKNLAAFRIFVP